MTKDSGLAISHMLCKENFIIANTKYSNMKIVLCTLFIFFCLPHENTNVNINLKKLTPKH